MDILKHFYKKMSIVLFVLILSLTVIPVTVGAAGASDVGLLKGTGALQYQISHESEIMPDTAPVGATTTGILTDGDLYPGFNGWTNKHVFDLGKNKLHTITSYQLAVGQAIANSLEFYDNVGVLIKSIVVDQHQFTKTEITPVTGVRYVVLKTGNWIGELEVFGSLEASSPELGNINNLSALAKDSSIDLNWSKITDATSYIVKRSTTPGGPYTVLNSTVSGNTYSDTSAVAGITYYYVVIAVNANGQSAPSNEASAKINSSGRAILTINISGGQVKEYDLSSAELESFLNWYDAKDSGSGPSSYKFIKSYNKGPFKSRAEYVVFNKITSFNVDEYDLVTQ